MTPQEKAKKLFEYHYFFLRNDQERRYLSIQCALITVNEVIEAFWYTHKNESEYRYWQEVKQEIQKI
jgi:hypothetical protein